MNILNADVCKDNTLSFAINSYLRVRFMDIKSKSLKSTHKVLCDLEKYYDSQWTSECTLKKGKK